MLTGHRLQSLFLKGAILGPPVLESRVSPEKAPRNDPNCGTTF